MKLSNLLLLGIILTFKVTLLQSQTHVACKVPPGGQVTCEQNQVAICSVVNGVVDAHCVNITEGATSSASTFKFFIFYQVVYPGYRSLSDDGIKTFSGAKAEIVKSLDAEYVNFNLRKVIESGYTPLAAINNPEKIVTFVSVSLPGATLKLLN